RELCYLRSFQNALWQEKLMLDKGALHNSPANWKLSQNLNECVITRQNISTTSVSDTWGK
ncbi:MAG: hypothetical protein SPL45_01830, partial [Schwartzia succinivorans]|nr:hypothetical protein [Schwartzia succinivorans]